MPCRWYCMCIVSILSTQYPFALSAILSQPMNTVAVAKSRVKLGCRRHPHVFPFDWEFAPASSNDFSYIYTSQRITESLSSRYKIDTDNRSRYDIVIESVDVSHAGTYRCTPITEEVVNISSYSAELTVLALEPVCGNNASASNDSFVEGDYIAMWCAISYLGNYRPFMEWTVSTETAIDADVFYTNATTVTSSLTIQLNSRNNGATFMCKMSFKPNSTKIIRTPRPTDTLANNDPQYQLLWNLTLNVLYGPRNLTVTHQGTEDVYEVGDHIVCFADGNPPPTHEWMDTETNRTINGSVLTVDDKITSDMNYNFKCTAYNTVAGVRKQIDKTITFTVKGGGAQPSPASLTPVTTRQAVVIGISAGAFVLCVSIVIILYATCRKVKSKRQEALAERQRQSMLNRDETTLAIEHFQYQMAAEQSFGQELNYAHLMDRSFNDQQYNRLHIYANDDSIERANANANAEYANREFMELIQLTGEHFNNADN